MEKLVTGYLGPEGTYSQIAAGKLCKDNRLLAYPSFYTLFSALERGEVASVVLPIENTVNGAVVQNLDLLSECDGMYASAACAVKIDHRLITLAGADRKEIKHVYSHPQALGQCAKYLAVNFPQAQLHETASTADSIKMIKSAEYAGIVGVHCQKAGYELSACSISDEQLNYTQFLLIEKGAPKSDAFSDRIFFTVTCRHKVGALVELLAILKDNGVNMTEIESRPIKGKTGEFRFFIEAEGNFADDNVKYVLKRMERVARSYKFLGCYVCGLPK